MKLNEKKLGLIPVNTSHFLRGIAILMVILSHYFEWGEPFVGSEKLATFMSALGDYGVGIFFFLSGYAIYKGYGIKNTDGKYLWKRFKNTYFPYLLVAFAIALYVGEPLGFMDVLRIFGGGDFWFVTEILIIYVAFYLAGKLPYKYRVFIMSVFVIDLSIYYYVTGHQDFWYTATWPFALGMILSKYELRFGFVRNGFSINIKDYVLTFLGKRSLYIYILHSFIYFRVMGIEAFNQMGMNWYLGLLISMVITAAAAFVLEFVLKKFFELIEKFWNKKGKGTAVASVWLIAGILSAYILVPVNAKADTVKSVDELVDELAYLIDSGASTKDVDAAFDAVRTAQAMTTVPGKRDYLVEFQADIARIQSDLQKAQAELARQKATQDAIRKASEEAAKALAEQEAMENAVLPIIVVGDSRTVQMHKAVGDDTGVCFIGENSRGYDWFVANAIPRIDKHVGKGTKIVINLGVNDPGNADKYIETVNRKALEWTAKGAKVYYATVYPVTENDYTTDEQVQVLNGKLIKGLQNVEIIDTYTWLKSTGFRMIDGLHFADSSYLNIFAYLMMSLAG